MNGVYKSLKVRVQDTFQMGKAGPAPAITNKSSGDLSLNNEMEKLERVVAEGLSKLKAAVEQDEATMAGEVRQAEQAIGSLKGSVASLEAKLKEAEETERKKDSSRQQIEETLKAKIHDLQNDAKGKEQALAAQTKEINDLRSILDAKVKQVSELEAASANTREEAASYMKRAEDLAEVSRVKVERLESQLKEKEELASRKDSSIKELEEMLAAKIQDFEKLAKNKQELLAGRDAVISDLKSQLKLLTKGIGEMSSFFKQAQAFTVIDRQDASPNFPNAPVNRRGEEPVRQASSTKIAPVEGEKPDAARWSATARPFIQEKKPAAVQLDGVAAVASNGPNPAPPDEKAAAAQPNGKTTALNRGAEPEILSQDVFERMSRELAELAGVMSPLATLIVREHVEGLGESIDSFPKSRFPELIDSLSREMPDEPRQVDFRKRLIDVPPSAVSS